MSDKEIKIGHQAVGENSKVTLKLSTLAWIVGGLLSIISTLATIGYYDIKDEVKHQKSLLETEKDRYEKDMRDLLNDELQSERDKREKLTEDLGEMKGDIKVILEKTRYLEQVNASNNPSSIPTPISVTPQPSPQGIPPVRHENL